MKTLDILYPNGNVVTVCPVPRSKLAALNSLMKRIYGIWLEKNLSAGDVFMDDNAWDAMSQVAAMLPRHDNPAVSGFDLESISSDYEQLQKLFLGGGNFYDGETFDYSQMIEAAIWEMHAISSSKKLTEVAMEAITPEPSPSQMSPPPKAATRKQTA